VGFNSPVLVFFLLLIMDISEVLAVSGPSFMAERDKNESK
jgi:hypothetical protein